MRAFLFLILIYGTSVIANNRAEQITLTPSESVEILALFEPLEGNSPNCDSCTFQSQCPGSKQCISGCCEFKAFGCTSDIECWPARCVNRRCQ